MFIPSQYIYVFEREVDATQWHYDTLDITHFYEIYNIEKYMYDLFKSYHINLINKFLQNAPKHCLIHVGRIQTWYKHFHYGVEKTEEINNYIEFYSKKQLILDRLNSYDNVLLDNPFRSVKNKLENYHYKISFTFNVKLLSSVVLIDTYEKFCENIKIYFMYNDNTWIKIYFTNDLDSNIKSIENFDLNDFWQIWKSIFVSATIHLNQLSQY
jgi:hypothetical protein